CFDVLDIEHGVTIINTADDVDDVFEEMLRRLSTFVLEDPRNLGHVISLTLIARSFERVGQHALNLAEYVVCLVGGAELIQQHRNPSSLNTGTGER
ncbi:MAG: PhoU domain-containing protein, partial [bacterium]